MKVFQARVVLQSLVLSLADDRWDIRSKEILVLLLILLLTGCTVWGKSLFQRKGNSHCSCSAVVICD